MCDPGIKCIAVHKQTKRHDNQIYLQYKLENMFHYRPLKMDLTTGAINGGDDYPS